jgi:hypothetical protein
VRSRRHYLLATALAVPAAVAAILVGRSLWAAPNAPPVDRTKKVIELRPQALLAGSAPAPGAPAPAFNNPKVAPGKVRWHADQDTAVKAAARSGKPVLLFLMMGRLDQRFC